MTTSRSPPAEGDWGYWERWETRDRIVAAWVVWLDGLGGYSVWATLTYRVAGIPMHRTYRHPFEFARAAARYAGRHVVVVAEEGPSVWAGHTGTRSSRPLTMPALIQESCP